MKTIRDIIKESGRHEDVMNIVFKLALRNSSYPLYKIQYTEANGVIYRINPENIRKDIELWNNIIDTDGSNIKLESNTLDHFKWVVESEVEARLHNYANSCSHRNRPSEEDLEEIRVWQILYSSINAIRDKYYNKEGGYIEFNIPNGWKKINNNDLAEFFTPNIS